MGTNEPNLPPPGQPPYQPPTPPTPPPPQTPPGFAPPPAPGQPTQPLPPIQEATPAGPPPTQVMPATQVGPGGPGGPVGPGGTPPPLPPEQPKKKNTALIIGGAIVGAALIIGGILLFTGGDDKESSGTVVPGSSTTVLESTTSTTPETIVITTAPTTTAEAATTTAPVITEVPETLPESGVGDGSYVPDDTGTFSVPVVPGWEYSTAPLDLSGTSVPSLSAATSLADYQQDYETLGYTVVVVPPSLSTSDSEVALGLSPSEDNCPTYTENPSFATSLGTAYLVENTGCGVSGAANVSVIAITIPDKGVILSVTCQGTDPIADITELAKSVLESVVLN